MHLPSEHIGTKVKLLRTLVFKTVTVFEEGGGKVMSAPLLLHASLNSKHLTRQIEISILEN